MKNRIFFVGKRVDGGLLSLSYQGYPDSACVFCSLDEAVDAINNGSGSFVKDPDVRIFEYETKAVAEYNPKGEKIAGQKNKTQDEIMTFLDELFPVAESEISKFTNNNCEKTEEGWQIQIERDWEVECNRLLKKKLKEFFGDRYEIVYNKQKKTPGIGYGPIYRIFIDVKGGKDASNGS